MKPALTPAQRKRATWDRLVASLPVQQNTRLIHDHPAKQKPASGVMRTI